jgi:hypothetical protein
MPGGPDEWDEDCTDVSAIASNEDPHNALLGQPANAIGQTN